MIGSRANHGHKSQDMDQRSKIIDEIEYWQSANGQSFKETVDLYVDLKSPHGYLSVRPSLQLALDYQVHINFIPYTLSYAGLGLINEISSDMKRRPASKSADRKARMYYTAAREYASLQGLPFRTPHRLLDSELAHRALLFAKHQNLEIPFIIGVYTIGWESGWRNFELESLDDLQSILIEIGADVSGYEGFVADGGPGQLELAAALAQAEASGIVGVPHYVVDEPDSERRLGLFGREHLSLIRSKLSERGLERTPGVSAAFPHTWTGPSR